MFNRVGNAPRVSHGQSQATGLLGAVPFHSKARGDAHSVKHRVGKLITCKGSLREVTIHSKARGDAHSVKHRLGKLITCKGSLGAVPIPLQSEGRESHPAQRRRE